MTMKFLLSKQTRRGTSFALLLLALGVTISMNSCTDTCSTTYITLNPVMTSVEEVRSHVPTMKAPRDLENPGKIYYYQNKLLINEVGAGIHVYDNADPENPTPIGFLDIPGNVDMAIRNNVLYADSYMDLVSINVSDWSAPVGLGRIENLYNSKNYPMGDGLNGWFDETNGQLVTAWQQGEISGGDDCNLASGDWRFIDVGGTTFAMESASSDLASVGGSSGQGGSMARITLAANRLYAVDFQSLHVVGLSNPAEPDRVNTISLTWGVETIFPSGNLLFFGTTSGLLIHSLDNPDAPEFLSEISHAVACDPVVVQDDLAYYTIRSGNRCGQGEDLLGVVDISNPRSPVEVATYNMDSPYGLGISGDALFLCQGDKGLQVFDASDHMKIATNQVKRYPDVHAWDVIPLGELLLMVGENGLYQFDYSDLNNIRQLSVIHTPK